MAKIVEDVLVVKLSKIVKDDATDSTRMVGSDVQSAIEAVIQELVGDSIVVEVVQA
jgi:hypothetical protein